ncbi:MAG: DNA-directed RNA polymerase subunit beta [Candidatus Omnitrophica bacterium]|nr:DNA-directed RNA polymerase subunit beta [Candidatus Omnitrophota bacterium]
MAVKRQNTGHIREVLDFPNLTDVQTESYAQFLQWGVSKTKRKDVGLQAVFKEVFPIESYDGQYRLEYVSYTLSEPKFTLEECARRGLSYATPLKVRLRLKGPKETKEQDVFMGELPLITRTGTFVINGDERVVVSQLHRSPGASYEKSLHPNGKTLYSARIIPNRGAWLEFEFDINDVLYAFIDRRRKILASTVLRAFGFSEDKDIIQAFCGLERVEGLARYNPKNLIGHTIAEDAVDPESQLVLVEKGTQINKELLAKLIQKGVKSIMITRTEVPEIVATLKRDHTHNSDEALMDIYHRIRPGDPPTLDSAKNLIHRLFFDVARYDLSSVGRYVINRKLDLNLPVEQRVLDQQTVIEVVKRLIRVKNGEADIDDIDHLGNRRVRTVGELLQAQFRIGLARLERSCRERMGIYDLDTMMPHNLVNSKLLSSVIRDFFGRSPLSQYMDQTNPLAELTHKRRVSALGPGGLSRERAGFEVRDVHHSHYGRICPIETPEGPNIGLIASLSTYSRINEYGFIETPYRKVSEGRVTDKVDYLSADYEDRYVIAQANARLDEEGNFLDKKVSCRFKGDFPFMSPKQIHYMDVSPKQLVSVAAGLIPFLEHDDANRALMGSNMQRQGVPLLFTEAPLVGTGIEGRVASDSGATILSEDNGVVSAVDAREIVIAGKRYPMHKYRRSNASTTINQRPLVKLGEKIKKGQVIADGPATQLGELALGRNVLVAFMPWRGYNFEDAIILSQRLVRDDVYTSVHIEEFEIEARDTRLGKEEITRDIPNVGEEDLRNLDEEGIVRIGAEVKPGDILVGKVTPKSETELSPEEKLLRAIFGEKAGDVRDASLVVPPGVSGVIIDTKIFARKGPASKSREERKKERDLIEGIKANYDSQIQKCQENMEAKLAKLLVGKRLASSLVDQDSEETVIAAKKTIGKGDIKKLILCDLDSIKIEGDELLEEDVRRIARVMNDQIEELRYEEGREIDKVKRGDELPPGVLKKISVQVASKRKISVGDKMAGRHGNKGVIARILPMEDMPYLADGTPVDIVLNPLGVPSRMNVGQLLETQLGWAGKVLGISFQTPVFDGASEALIHEYVEKAGLPVSGKTVLYDGQTGEAFDQTVTTGYIYMLKLAHLVDDKIHARSTGPYSLVTQQPLGGKAQFGGQRLGEMEVWALEAYGAAYTLQELLTVKSDDVQGRTRIYEEIVKGDNTFKPGVPESFNVLIRELHSLCLDVRMEKTKATEGESK